ncbi:hypothetical protein HYN59_06075 [Flavobacterium album]|uniref:Uncharacterized protein n=1 Tax=Flavobacterium album TaxID=2175091 RepID=A0A2S1QWF4_9FLAO|nr:hypothetical protein [Flavobacterium album]AWH84713.1 hypothetical protein HYN59_06075 [Flavobacterium album]
MTDKDLYNRICDLQATDVSLETYLLSLLKLVEKEKSREDVPAELFLQILQDAFTSEPAKFNPEWLKIKKAPKENPNASGYDYAVAVIQFQISDLRKMKGKQLDDPYKTMGIDSETGERWYNFDPMGNLECGARCCVDGGSDENEYELLDWGFLGQLLEMGRIYE